MSEHTAGWQSARPDMLAEDISRLEASNAKLLTTLEAIQKELFEYSVANNFGKSRIVSRCIDLAREAIREVKGESLCQD